MIGGWRPWKHWMTARRLARHGRREGGAPPPDLLRRLREDIPALPAMTYEPAAGRNLRRSAPGRWLVAASLAATLTGGVVGLRVWEARSHLVEQAAPAAAGKPSAAPRAGSSTAPGGAAPAAPAAAREREVLALDGQKPLPAPAAPPVASASPASQSADERSPLAAGPAGPPGAAAPKPRQPAGLVGAPQASRTEPPSQAPTRGRGLAREKAAAGATTGNGQQRPKPAPGSDAGAHGTEDQITVASESPADSLAAPAEESRRRAETSGPGADARRPQRLAAKAAAPREPPAGETAAGGSAAPRDAAAAPPATAGGSAPPALRALGKTPPPPPPAIAAPDRAAPLRSSFGADTGTDSYRRLRRGLLAEGRLPRAASVRADELANAFDLASETPAVGRPELSVEGAPLPVPGAVYLLRFEVRGLMGPAGAGAVEVEFDPAVVARFRRVGATANRGGATALYEVELRPAAWRAASAGGAANAASTRGAGAAGADAGFSPTGAPPASPQAPSARQSAAASSRPAGELRDATAASPGSGDRVIATLRLVAADRINVGGNLAGDDRLAGRALRLSQLRPSWAAASPALRAPGLAVQFAQALAAKDPGPRLQELRIRAQALAAELPDDPKAAELLDLVERAAVLAGAHASPPPPR
jgi:hypothetical protein